MLLFYLVSETKLPDIRMSVVRFVLNPVTECHPVDETVVKILFVEVARSFYFIVFVEVVRDGSNTNNGSEGVVLGMAFCSFENNRFATLWPFGHHMPRLKSPRCEEFKFGFSSQ